MDEAREQKDARVLQPGDLLGFERRKWKSPGAKEQAIQETFGINPTRYYQELNALIASDEAYALDPVSLGRLRRLRERRRALRVDPGQA